MALDLSSVATKLLKNLGSNNFAIIKKTEPTYDPDTGLPDGDVTETSTPAFGALVSYKQPLIDGTNIMTGDKRLLLEPSAPYVYGDVIEALGDRYSVVADNTINPTGKIQVIDLQVRPQ
ncbi:MAG: hypothetical protein GY774_20650 [Planctomycetes bacterium]|nr:hypothetical protein [Planctomycetota bacterium]